MIFKIATFVIPLGFDTFSVAMMLGLVSGPFDQQGIHQVNPRRPAGHYCLLIPAALRMTASGGKGSVRFRAPKLIKLPSNAPTIRSATSAACEIMTSRTQRSRVVSTFEKSRLVI